MKVLVISHTYIAPINREKWQVFAKQHKDVQLKVLFPNIWPDAMFTLHAGEFKKDNLDNCEFIALDTFNSGNEVLYGYYPRQFIKLIKAFKPDLIHVEQGDNAFSFFQTILFSKLFSRKSKFSFFTWINWKPRHSIKYKLIWSFVEMWNRYFSAGAIVGNHDAKMLLKEKGFLRPVEVLPQLGVNKDLFIPATNINRDKKYIGFIGRLVPEKGVHLLLEAFNKLYSQYPDWNLKILGEGKEEGDLKKYVSCNNLQDRVEFLPAVSHKKVVSVFHSMDILVLPSYDTFYWKEQFGHVLIEAMSCKVVVVGSTGGEIPNVIGDAGFVFQQKNKLQLYHSLKSLMDDENLRLQLSEKGLKRVKENFSHEAIAKKTYEFWQEFLR